MKAIKGNKTINLSKTDLDSLIAKYEKVHIDIGTGDGRYVFKSAQKNPDTFFIGVDPSQKQLEIYSKKAVRRKLPNVLFILGSIETFPTELFKIADSISILLPWGTLLQSVVKPISKDIQTISKLLKPNGTLEIVFGYSQDAEPSEVARLGLDKLDMDYVQTKIVPAFAKEALKMSSVSEFSKENFIELDSTWGKKLKYGSARSMFKLNFVKKDPHLL